MAALLSTGASGAAQVTFLLSYRMYEVVKRFTFEAMRAPKRGQLFSRATTGVLGVPDASLPILEASGETVVRKKKGKAESAYIHTHIQTEVHVFWLV